MWTRKDIKEFKDQIRKEKEAVIKIGSGETVTVWYMSGPFKFIRGYWTEKKIILWMFSFIKINKKIYF